MWTKTRRSHFSFLIHYGWGGRNIQKLLTYKQCSPNYYSRQARVIFSLRTISSFSLRPLSKELERSRKYPFQRLQFRRPYWNGALNNLKCNLLFGHVPIDRRNQIKDLFYFPLASFPKKCLGVPLFQGQPKKSHFSYLVEAFNKRLAGWKSKLLSFAGPTQTCFE